jgi:hypothetical protein
MQIVMTRLDARRYSTIVQRDGVQLQLPGYGFMRALPHGLAHCVVEGSFGLERALWGSVAGGAEFSRMERIEGRRKPHSTEKAKTTSKENADYLTEAEWSVACFEKIVDGNLDRVPRLVETELREALATVLHRSRAITGSDIAKVCGAWREMQARWNGLSVGESIRIDWRSARASGKKH